MAVGRNERRRLSCRKDEGSARRHRCHTPKEEGESGNLHDFVWVAWFVVAGKLVVSIDWMVVGGWSMSGVRVASSSAVQWACRPLVG